MFEKDFDNRIKEIAERAKQERKQELADEKVMEKEEKAQEIANAESKASPKQKESTLFTAVIVTKLEYEGVNTPSREQLAEDLGTTIMKWVNQKSYYAIGSKAPVPKLVSIDVDIK
jgi:hypothetical protein